jgi:quercetin dioxygenase-like cupin family protein
MITVFNKAAHSVPVDFSGVETQWRLEGFSFGVFHDPPGQEWNNFTHQSDEYVLVAEGRLKIDVGNEKMICAPGDLVRIPRQVRHSLKTVSANGSVWLYGYGFWGSNHR